MSDRCTICNCILPPLNGSEENDFRLVCEFCELIDSEDDDLNDYDEQIECSHCSGDHSSFLCKEVMRFDDMDCFKCGETFFFSSGHCSSCGNKQY